ncbi:hypothetical protein Taro_011535 [Colocasia esculenta]|uniref:Uncharacterized protein n=1 Tax=Colocasia esculenta TaxID=4460 RepID=A0A843U1P5_COLES|nr:hypothetical protein [Colocasia esculenta]
MRCLIVGRVSCSRYNRREGAKGCLDSPERKVKCRMWTFRMAVAIGGRGVDANLRILQVIGSPEGRFCTWFSSSLAPTSRPCIPKASNRLRSVRGRRTRIKYVIGLTGLAEAFRHRACSVDNVRAEHDEGCSETTLGDLEGARRGGCSVLDAQVLALERGNVCPSHRMRDFVPAAEEPSDRDEATSPEERL